MVLIDGPSMDHQVLIAKRVLLIVTSVYSEVHGKLTVLSSTFPLSFLYCDQYQIDRNCEAFKDYHAHSQSQ